MTSWPQYGARVPLWSAVYAQDAGQVHKLLAGAAGPQQVNVPHGIWMQTAVHVAVSKGHSKILKALLFAGADVNARTINGTTPLHLAIGIRRKDLIKDLLLVGADPMLRNYTNRTAIDMARDAGLVDVLPSLIEAANSLPIQRELKRQQQEAIART